MKFKRRLEERGYPENSTERSYCRTFIAFCHNVPTASLKFKTNTDGALESVTQSALAEEIFYKTSNHLLQKGKIP